MNLKEAEFWLPDSMLEFIEKMKDSYKNLFKKEELKEYADEVWKIIQTTYDRIGGSAGIKTKEDLIEESNFWKLVLRGGEVTAVVIYKMSEGKRKGVVGGHDGTIQGKKDFFALMKEDITQVRKGAYLEASETLEEMLETLGMPKVPIERVPNILRKKISPSEDGYHYKRLIGDVEHEKILLGY